MDSCCSQSHSLRALELLSALQGESELRLVVISTIFGWFNIII